MLFAGDVMGHGPQVRAAFDSSSGTYNYEPCFRFVKSYVQQADVAIANLEVVLGGEPYTGYPVFSSPDELAAELKRTGFDILVQANNHCYDKGKYGFERSIKTLDSLSIPHFGTYLNSTERTIAHPYILEKNGLRIALLNYTYGTNGIVAEKPNVVNYINKDQILADIAKADSLHVDFIIAIMHWGLEYELAPNKEQKDLASFLARNGCDAVIGSHPHVVQTFETIYPNASDSSKQVPVFYSMGNYVSNQRDRYRNGGAMFTLELQKNDSSKKVSNCKYIPYWVYKGVYSGKYQYYILPLSVYFIDEESFNLPKEDREKLLQFSNDIKERLPNIEDVTTIPAAIR